MQTERGRQHREVESSFRVPDRIAVFPLPTVVLFPRIYLPRHICEPGYRAMIAEAVAEGKCFGVALLKEGWEQQYCGNPPVFGLGCVGRLVSVQRLPDGRLNILLQGLSRYQIHEQFYDRSYRQASVVLKPSDSEVALESSVRSDLLHLTDEYLNTREDRHRSRGLFRPDVSDEILLNSLSTYLDFTPLLIHSFLAAATSPHQVQRPS